VLIETETRPPVVRPGRVLGVLLTAQFMANVDIAIVNVAGPAIHDGLHTSGGELELAVSGYTLAFAMLLITGARLGVLYGHRRIFRTGLAVFTVTSLACGLAPTAVTLILARLAQGAGAALMVPQVLTGIQQNYAGPARARALGWYAAVLGGSAVTGQVLGGVLTSANLFGSGWRPVFLINVPVGLALAFLAKRFLPPDKPSGTERLDLPGVGLLSAALLLTLVPLVLGRDLGWPWWTWVCFAASVAVLARFVRWERRVTARGGHPLLALHILRLPAVSWGLLGYGCALMTYFSTLFTIALYLQRGFAHSAFYSGMTLVSWVSAFGVAGLLVRRIPTRFAPAIGAVLMTGTFVALALVVARHEPGGVLLMTLLGLGGFGLGFVANGMTAHLTSSVDVRHAADLSGALLTTNQLSGALGIAAFGSVYIGLAPGPGGTAAGHAFTAVLAAFAVCTAIGAVAIVRAVRWAR
jgi:MFS family permease